MQDIVIDDIDLFDSIELQDDATPSARALHEAVVAKLLQALTIRRDGDGDGPGSLMVVFSLGEDRYLEWHAGLDGSAADDGVLITVATLSVDHEAAGDEPEEAEVDPDDDLPSMANDAVFDAGEPRRGCRASVATARVVRRTRNTSRR